MKEETKKELDAIFAKKQAADEASRAARKKTMEVQEVNLADFYRIRGDIMQPTLIGLQNYLDSQGQTSFVHFENERLSSENGKGVERPFISLRLHGRAVHVSPPGPQLTFTFDKEHRTVAGHRREVRSGLLGHPPIRQAGF